MKAYVSPTAEFIEFGNDRLNTTASKCDCFAARWTYNENDWDNCDYITGDFSEVGDANNGL